MVELVPITEAKARLSELVHTAEREDVVLVRHSRPAAVIVSVNRYEAMLDRLEEAEDRLSVHEATGDTISLAELERHSIRG